LDIVCENELDGNVGKLRRDLPKLKKKLWEEYDDKKSSKDPKWTQPDTIFDEVNKVEVPSENE
jgi:hypothetical protein